MEEMAKRTAEAGSGMAAAIKAAAIQNQVANMAAHRRRLSDDHVAGFKAMGFDVAPQEEDAVGDIIVTGDIYSDDAIASLKSTPQPEQKPASKASPLLKLAAAAGLMATGAGATAAIPLAVSAFTEKTPPVTAPVDTDTLTRVRVFAPEK